LLIDGSRYFLDANIVIFLMKERRATLTRRFEAAVESGVRFLMPVLVRQELEVGVLRNKNMPSARMRLEGVMNFVDSVVPYDDGDAQVAGQIHADLLKIGRPVGPYDLLIASQVIRRRGVLVTNNVEELSRVPGLIIEDWTQD
jgi:tRNA(fMet)-specific endonuclease VapC